MRRTARSITVAAVAAATLTLAVAASPLPAVADAGAATEYTVLAADNASADAAAAAIVRAGGRVVARNDAVGMFQVVASGTGFAARADAAPELTGAALRVPIGRAPAARPDSVELEASGANAGVAPAQVAPAHRKVGPDPLDDKLWGMQQIHADQAHRVTLGSHRVTVGILDTGVDASNPDIAPNFNWALSRNFAKDIPAIDGPCEVPSCLDPVGTDDGGHGTHVAGIIGAAANGIGLTGVAPGVSLVELKGGQDSGFFFLEPVVNALTYAGDHGVDVVNMSFFVDPWLFNCQANPADTPAQQAEQRTIVAGMVRALSYAHRHGVTLVAALGNEHEDMGNPLPDSTSPDYPAGTAYTRTIDNRTCLTMPTEGPFVIGVSATGPSGKKADYSNYGTEQISVAAPGGWFRDGFGTPTFRTPGNEVLSTFPEKVLQEQGTVDANGNIVPGNEGSVFKQCTRDGRCGYYTYLQGTSMASPHAAGVAALIVSRYGHPDFRGGLTMDPNAVESILLRTASEHACPNPPLQTYTNEGRPAEFNALCTGSPRFNGFYGHGIVNAFAAVTAH
ncbi:MAG TPA: S8 family serine peptidase [Rugosimonospora sp.]|nr:S8 family serine peptidase [Rugosimonospora sp.]